VTQAPDRIRTWNFHRSVTQETLNSQPRFGGEKRLVGLLHLPVLKPVCKALPNAADDDPATPMDDPLSQLIPGRSVTAHLTNGQVVRGLISGLRGGWISLIGTNDGDSPVLINLAHASALVLDAKAAPAPFVEVTKPKPTSKDAPIRAGGKALGRAWLDEDLKTLADAYLDGAEDGELAQRFNRSRGQIKELRQAFECARGNLVEEQISPIAATWVARWRKALTQ
jgi:hypothetical protein